MALIHLLRSYNFIQLFLLVSMLLFQRRSHGEEGGEFATIDLHSIETCKREQKNHNPSDSGKLEIVDDNHPCSSTTTKLVSHTQILEQDQSRVEAILARTKSNQFKDSKAYLPAQSGLPLNTGNYFVTVGLGTPMKKLSLVFDTGSDLSWTQCQPCSHCYPQIHKIFDPNASTSYSNISCPSPDCDQITNNTGNEPTCDQTSTCTYQMGYGDGSETFGIFSKDKLTLTPKDVVQDFMFGCSRSADGLFGKTDGLLGLGRESLSIVSQTTKRYGNAFSYCMPSSTNFTGFLRFGNSFTNKVMNFTPLHTNPDAPSFYYIKIISISVGGCKLPINYQSIFKSGTVIDSGTVITRLPPDAYKALSGEFRKHMRKYGKVRRYSILDTCYHNKKHTSMTIPSVSFTFENNVEVRLDSHGIIYFIDSLCCLAFATNGDPTDLAIFGNAQQRTLEVVYDVANERLGFGPGACH